jgi:hypothetical protein
VLIHSDAGMVGRRAVKSRRGKRDFANRGSHLADAGQPDYHRATHLLGMPFPYLRRMYDLLKLAHVWVLYYVVRNKERVDVVECLAATYCGLVVHVADEVSASPRKTHERASPRLRKTAV